MKTKRLIILLTAIVLLLSMLPSCGPRPPKEKFTEYSLDYFDTATTISGYAEDKEAFDTVCTEILSQLEQYHMLFTIYHRYDGMENLCTINAVRDGAHRVVEVDARIIDMLLYAEEMHDKTNGEINVAMGSVLSIWHQYRQEGMDEPWAAELPPMDALLEAAKHTDINCLVIDREASTVWISDPKMTLDVGAIAKGYAVEMVARSLEEKGISGYVINVGGNVRTVGTKADGEKWLAGVQNPIEDDSNPYAAYLGLAGEALVTSGSYQRYYVVDGRNYHHIIDRETLMPAEGYLSVSVVCKHSGQADALSTALFCMTPEEGFAFAEAMEGVEVLWILSDGTQMQTSGFSAYLTEPPK